MIVIKAIRRMDFPLVSIKGSGSYLVGEREIELSNDMGKKCYIGGVTGDSAGQADMGRMSSRVFVKDKQTENLGDKEFQDSDQPKDDARLSDSGSLSSSFSSGGLQSQPVDNASKVLDIDRPEKWNAFSFTSKSDGIGIPFVEFNTSKLDGIGMPFVEFKIPNPKANVFSGASERLEFSAKMEPIRDAKVKKKKGKLSQGVDAVL
ncbi:Heat shock protein DnaJ with tetratricopeptide repeat, putative isoform 1 [Melia azedarach]|uniref:Heat shock protein DnaJ with tetratricopeptide repeat, putative isoform 1 n=1 Tax=Melia azedarach TaxID=155640 RepID=A0ACC1YLP9_MELAZ|nr:Heat shock protein DnaJ with tetratricopeptide repeat, putative isoform 1 [Melia azedarach]